MGEYSRAISYYVQGTEIQHKFGGSNHPELAACFHNIASTCYGMRMHRWAIFFALLAVDIGQRKQPENHFYHIPSTKRGIIQEKLNRFVCLFFCARSKVKRTFSELSNICFFLGKQRNFQNF